MSNNIQKSVVDSIVAIFTAQMSSFVNGKVTVNVSRSFSKKGNISEKIEGNFAKLFFGQVCLVINQLNGHSGKTPLSDDKYYSHSDLIAAIEKAKDVKSLFVGVNDDKLIQQKITNLSNNIKLVAKVDNKALIFSNASLMTILKSAAKCYKLTTSAYVPKVVKAKDVKAKAPSKSKAKKDAAKTAPKTAPRKNWFKFVSSKGIKPNEFASIAAKRQKALKAEFAAL